MSGLVVESSGGGDGDEAGREVEKLRWELRVELAGDADVLTLTTPALIKREAACADTTCSWPL